MPNQVKAWRASDGTYHGTWEEAAFVEAKNAFLVLMPGFPEGYTRDEMAADLAKVVFIDKDEQATKALAGMLHLFQTAPSEGTAEMAERFAPAASDRSRFKIFGGGRGA